MVALSIRNLDDGVARRLRVRAARNGRSVEAEVRSILEAAVRDTWFEAKPFEAFMACFTAIGGVDLEIPPRSAPPRSADFS